MTKLRMLVVPAVLLAVALPAQARAGNFSGVVVAKQAQRGTVLLAGARGVGITVRGKVAHAVLGERVAVQGLRLRDGTVRMSRLRVLSRVHATMLRGTVIRELAGGTLLASGRSVVMIHRSGRHLASASDHGDLRAGDVADFRVRFDEDDDLVEEAPPVQVGQAAVARIEGTIVSLSPFVVSTEGLPLTITVPAGVTLPAGLAAGQRIELTVQIGTGNTFTLVAIDEDENALPAVQAQEVEVKGSVVSSTASQLVVTSNGRMFTFTAPAGTTLPVLAAGTFVEVRGIQQSGTLTAERVRVEDQNGDGDGGGHDGDGGH
jgi:hypothetical protein